MIDRELVRAAMYEALVKSATLMPPDVLEALERALSEETDPLAVRHLEVTLENARLSAEGNGLVCADTGYPLFYVKAGERTRISGGFGSLEEAAREATAEATKNSFLRPTMVDPITRKNPGDNCLLGMPAVHLSFSGPGDGLEIVAVPKGGGSEIFGTFYRMLYPSDGLQGVYRFVLDSVRDGCYAGKVCPPAIVGVGIGGTADICMAMAKEAAVLTPIGARNPDPSIAEIENKLLHAFHGLGLGPLGSKGKNAVLDLHVRTAATHTAALPVAVNAQCSIGRRWKATIEDSGKVTYSGAIDG